MLQHHARQLRVGGLVGVRQPGLDGIARRSAGTAAGMGHVGGEGVVRLAAVQHLLHVVDGAQAHPGAAGLVTGREAPAADFDVAAVGQLDFADAAGAQRDDGARLAGVRAQHCGMAVAFQRHARVARIGGDKRGRPVLVVHARQAEADGDARGGGDRQAGGAERLRGSVGDGGPGIGNTVHQTGWTGGAFRDVGAVGARQAYPGAAAAAINADEKFDHVYLRKLWPEWPGMRAL
ncbi:conserved hypothetical protein [Ricinus communis]|uniref:Uncharacterized protein n=1 Tax=Ricinus communis TaxID=3988 RepID=B9TQ45_RICCO|nr:conserved hypothetical protein [Ricinus communis]